MKATEIKLTEKSENIVYNFFRSQNELSIVNVVTFDNGYQTTIPSIKCDLANEGAFASYKEETAFLKTWSNAKRLDFINNNINRLPFANI